MFGVGSWNWNAGVRRGIGKYDCFILRGRNYDFADCSTLARKRWRTVFLIVFSWTIPTATAVVGVIKWNCGKKCSCIHGAEGELCPFSEGCSRVWPPLKNGFMALQVGLWFLEVGAFNNILSLKDLI